MTHYIPAFTVNIGRLQKAACGLPIEPRMHSDEPSCEECLAYVLADAAATAEELFGAEEPMKPFGEVPDVRTEFEQAMDRRFGGRR